MTAIQAVFRKASLVATGVFAIGFTPLAAQQLETVDPDSVFAEGAIDGDLAPALSASASPAVETSPDVVTYSRAPVEAQAAPEWSDPATAAAEETAGPAEAATAPQLAEADSSTYAEDDLIGAAEGVFGKGAEGLARMIEKMLKEQGEPNAYIVGREGGGAFIAGVRYGSGTMHHKVEGERKVYWTGPSVGFDVGANAANTFVLVYNLWDSEELFERYPAGEGQAYVVGGLTASYLRKGDVVLIPIRMGAGLRLGINAGYMKFSKKQRWLPF